jgi:hypothetical protein
MQHLSLAIRCVLAVCWLTALLIVWPAASRAAGNEISDPERYSFAQQYLLLEINRQRDQVGVQRVSLAPLACQSAKLHADDMLEGSFFSHWNRAGMKPTRRYNLLGGCDALGENIYYKHGSPRLLSESLDEMLATLLDSEGHRKTLLDPAYTHVGLGFAMSADGRDFYGVQDFIARLGGEYRYPLSAQLGAQIRFSGRFDPYSYSLAHVIIGYEERPEPRSVKWLMRTSSYGDANKLFAGYTADQRIEFRDMQTYYDLEVDPERGWFECRPVLDFKGNEGLYYLFLWLKDNQTGKPTLAATATVDVRK